MGSSKSIFKNVMFVINAGKDPEMKIKCTRICHLSILSCIKKGENIGSSINFEIKILYNLPKVGFLMKRKKRPTEGFWKNHCPKSSTILLVEYVNDRQQNFYGSIIKASKAKAPKNWWQLIHRFFGGFLEFFICTFTYSVCNLYWVHNGRCSGSPEEKGCNKQCISRAVLMVILFK